MSDNEELYGHWSRAKYQPPPKKNKEPKNRAPLGLCSPLIRLQEKAINRAYKAFCDDYGAVIDKQQFCRCLGREMGWELLAQKFTMPENYDDGYAKTAYEHFFNKEKQNGLQEREKEEG